MIRRSPTRLELKLDDMQEFEFVQKADRRKVLLSCTGIEEAKKLIRQERVGFSGAVASRLPTATTTTTPTPGSRRIHHSAVTPPVQPNPRPSTSNTRVATLTFETPTQTQEDDQLIRDLMEMVESDPHPLPTDEEIAEMNRQAPEEDPQLVDDLE